MRLTFTLMDLSFDILDHIFSFLRSHPGSLIACSEAHPDLSPIAERHQYYHTIIHTGFTQFPYSFNPTRLLELISEKPRITNRVRILQVEFNSNNGSRSHDLFAPPPLMEEIALVLPRFPRVECLMLSTTLNTDVYWEDLPQTFRRAVGDCIHLRTLRELHIGDLDFPLCLLDHHTNIDFFSLSGDPQIPECLYTTYPRLKILSVGKIDDLFPAWAKRCIGNLQALECHYCESSADLLEGCSETLQNLFIGFWDREYGTTYNLDNGLAVDHGTPISLSLSSLRHLQHLTIHSHIFFNEKGDDYPFNICVSFLPAIIELLKTAPPLHHVTLDICLDLSGPAHVANFDAINFSPLTALAESCAAFHDIDLYIWAGVPPLGPVAAVLGSYQSLLKLVDNGTLMIYEDHTAPLFLDTVYSISHFDVLGTDRGFLEIELSDSSESGHDNECTAATP